MVFLAVLLESLDCRLFGEVHDGDDFHASCILFQALVDPVVVTVEDCSRVSLPDLFSLQ